MPTARSQTPPESKPKRGSWFMILCVLVMAAALTFLGLQRYGSTSRRTSATPTSAPARTASPDGAGSGSSPPANPNIDRNG